MKTFALMAVALVLVGAAPTQKDEKAAARKVIEKGIKALGGETNLRKYKALTYKAKGMIHLGKVPVTWAVTVQQPSQYRLTATGEGFQILYVLDGDKGWNRDDDGVPQKLKKEELEECREELYAHRVMSLVPLLEDKAFSLTLLGEAKVEGVEAVGVKVSQKGHRDVKLYFDKKAGLPILLERRIKDFDLPRNKWRELNQETFYRAYKEHGGVLRPGKIIVKWDKKLVSEMEVMEYTAHEKKVSDSTFARP
jgi:hypothetical protein